MTPTSLDGLVARDAELAVFQDFLDRLAHGRGGCALLEGEAGIGKSTLVAVLRDQARRAGFEVSHSTCDELRQRFPLAVLLDALGVDPRSPDPLRVWAATGEYGGSPSPPRADDDAEATARGWSVSLVGGDPVMAGVERLLELVDRLCANGPLVMAVDDLQWADEASLLVWHHLCRATLQLPLLLVGACRPVPRRTDLVRLRREIKARYGSVLSLDRLPREAVAELTRRVTGAPPGPALAERLELGAGNPFYVRELLDALARVRIATPSGPVTELADVAGPDAEQAADSRGLHARQSWRTLASAIADRIDFVSADTREVLRTAALLGADFSVAELTQVLGRSALDLAPTMEEAIAAGVLESEGIRLRFRHELLREALQESIPGPLRVTLRRDAAKALTAGGAPVEKVAELLLAATDAADGWELDWLAENAAGLSRRAPDVAAELIGHALGNAAHDDPRRDVLEDHLAALSFLMARYEQAEQSTRRILAAPASRERHGQAVWFLGYTLMRTNRLGEAHDLIARAVADPRASPVWQPRLGVLAAMAGLSADHYDEAAEAAKRILAAGGPDPDPMTAGYALHTMAMSRFARGDMPGTVEAIDQALAVVHAEPELTDLRLLLSANQAAALINLDRFAEAAERMRTARALAERTGTPRINSLIVLAGELAYQQGRWDDARAELATFADPTRNAFVQYLPTVVHGVEALIAGHRDDRRTANRHLHALPDATGAVAYQTNNGGYLLMARALAAESAGRADAAAAELRVLLDPEYAVMDDRASMFPHLVRLALDTADLPTARQAAEAARIDARANPLPRAVAAGDWCHGLIGSDPDLVLAAADAYRTAGRRLEHGNAMEDAAVLLAAAERVDHARSAAAEALAVYEGLGAVWDARRASARLRPHGVRPGVRKTRRRPQNGWAALTETETRVADLVRSGWSNPEIAKRLLLSRRTVETHVSHILAKLQAGSRREIAEIAESAGVTDGTGQRVAQH
ncbi:AAA family ATPase [Catenulispora sp. NF23]|uniref:AAA family ATPase n=1 Tax=Catenulispora pinistramenti TaxID=2705254 RepID=UPI001BA4BEA0|nr:LuxR family transcriptional regulator [Catenulispora pinistramenti]MBS2533650.1 AAA family ATPase [Catenulispora pinistramenti]